VDLDLYQLTIYTMAGLRGWAGFLTAALDTRPAADLSPAAAACRATAAAGLGAGDAACSCC